VVVFQCVPINTTVLPLGEIFAQGSTAA